MLKIEKYQNELSLSVFQNNLKNIRILLRSLLKQSDKNAVSISTVRKIIYLLNNQPFYDKNVLKTTFYFFKYLNVIISVSNDDINGIEASPCDSYAQENAIFESSNSKKRVRKSNEFTNNILLVQFLHCIFERKNDTFSGLIPTLLDNYLSNSKDLWNEGSRKVERRTRTIKSVLLKSIFFLSEFKDFVPQIFDILVASDEIRFLSKLTKTYKMWIDKDILISAIKRCSPEYRHSFWWMNCKLSQDCIEEIKRYFSQFSYRPCYSKIKLSRQIINDETRDHFKMKEYFYMPEKNNRMINHEESNPIKMSQFNLDKYCKNCFLRNRKFFHLIKENKSFFKKIKLEFESQTSSDGSNTNIELKNEMNFQDNSEFVDFIKIALDCKKFPKFNSNEENALHEIIRASKLDSNCNMSSHQIFFETSNGSYDKNFQKIDIPYTDKCRICYLAKYRFKKKSLLLFFFNKLQKSIVLNQDKVKRHFYLEGINREFHKFCEKQIKTEKLEYSTKTTHDIDEMFYINTFFNILSKNGTVSSMDYKTDLTKMIEFSNSLLSYMKYSNYFIRTNNIKLKETKMINLKIKIMMINYPFVPLNESIYVSEYQNLMNTQCKNSQVYQKFNDLEIKPHLINPNNIRVPPFSLKVNNTIYKIKQNPVSIKMNYSGMKIKISLLCGEQTICKKVVEVEK